MIVNPNTQFTPPDQARQNCFVAERRRRQCELSNCSGRLETVADSLHTVRRDAMRRYSVVALGWAV